LGRYGIPTTSESSDACLSDSTDGYKNAVSDSESLAEAKKRCAARHPSLHFCNNLRRYPQRLRMIVTGDVVASSSVDDVGVQVDVKQEAPLQQQRMQPAAQQQSGLCHEPSLAASLSICQSRSVSSSQAPPAAPPAAPALASASHDTNGRNDDAGMHYPSDWTELDQCIYPAASLRQTDYKVTNPPPHSHPASQALSASWKNSFLARKFTFWRAAPRELASFKRIRLFVILLGILAAA